MPVSCKTRVAGLGPPGNPLADAGVSADAETERGTRPVVQPGGVYLGRGCREGDVFQTSQDVDILRCRISPTHDSLRCSTQRGQASRSRCARVQLCSSSGKWWPLVGNLFSAGARFTPDVFAPWPFQIPAYRLPEVTYPVSSMLRSWIREAAGMSLYEVSGGTCRALLGARRLRTFEPLLGLVPNPWASS
jgi:hypothetical protein